MTGVFNRVFLSTMWFIRFLSYTLVLLPVKLMCVLWCYKWIKKGSFVAQILWGENMTKRWSVRKIQFWFREISLTLYCRWGTRKHPGNVRCFWTTNLHPCFITHKFIRILTCQCSISKIDFLWIVGWEVENFIKTITLHSKNGNDVVLCQE